jgi:hypothetical protein
MLAPRIKRKHRFTMLMSDDEFRKIKALAKLLGDGASAAVRAAINREYHTKITMKRQ